MARVASCPQCEHDLLVPDDAEPSALVKCPECRAFFELQHAESRELPAALVVQSHAGAISEPPAPIEEVVTEEFSPLAAFPSALTPTPELAHDEIKIEADDADILDFADEAPAAEHGSASLQAPHLADEFLAEESSDFKPAGTESHEEAAQRIDQWFRSAKTLSDIPPLDPTSDLEPTAHLEPTTHFEPAAHLEPNNLPGETGAQDEITEIFTPTNYETGDATIKLDDDITADFESGDADFRDATTEDFQIEVPADLSAETAPWDDSQHMDRLLADIEGQPIDTFEPAAHEESVADHEELLPDEEPLAIHDEHEQDPELEQFHAASDWTPDESLAIPDAPNQPERKRSVVRTLVGSAVGGVIGLALAYYALLWLGPVLNRGKDIDFLQVSNYLPKSILPPAFRKEVKPQPAQPPQMVEDLAATDKPADKAEENKPEATKPAEPVAPAAPATATAETPATALDAKQVAATEDVTKKSSTPDEKQATFTTPAEPPKKPVDTDDRYANPAPKNEPAMHEPAPLDTPPAKAITEAAPKAEPVHIAGAPSFSAADVAASLTAASAAESGLVTGNLQDGKEVTRTKGVSYMAIADFAQKATFADGADSAKAQQESDDFFRKLLSNAHTRDEVAQIAPRWLNHPKRAQNGVFLAGNASHGQKRGSVVEYNVELSGGPSVVVVVPAGTSLDSSTKPVGVVGSIVDHPNSEIAGYSGNAPQVIFAKKLLPLE